MSKAARLLPYLPLILLLPAMAWVSSGAPAVPPIGWVAAAAVALTLGWTVLERRPRLGDVLMAAALGIAATHRLLLPGFPRGHDIVTHLWGLYGFYQSMLHGAVAPRWVHQLGAGMPLGLFYPPAAFLGMAPFLALGSPVYDALKFGLVLFNALSGISMYVVAARWCGDRRAALVAAGVYCYAPYHLLQSHYRVSVSEAAAMAVLPLFFYHAQRVMLAPDRGHWRAAIVWTSILALTHPLSVIMAMVGAVIGWIGAPMNDRIDPAGSMPPAARSRRLARLAALGVAGCALAGYYVVPAVVEGDYATVRLEVGRGEGSSYYWHGLDPGQLLERRAWTRWQQSEPRDAPPDRHEMPFYFGLSLLALVPLARSRQHPAVIRGLQAMTLGALLLTLHPLDVLLAELPPIALLQFPWRFLAVGTFGASALAAFAVQRVSADAGAAAGNRRGKVEAGAALEARSGAAEDGEVAGKSAAETGAVADDVIGGTPGGLLRSRRGALVERVVPGLLFALCVIDAFPYGGAPMWEQPYSGIYHLSQAGPLPDPLPILRVYQLPYPPSDPRIDLSLLWRVYPEYLTPAVRKAFAGDDVPREALERASVGVAFRAGGQAEKLHPTPYAEWSPTGGTARALPYHRGGGRIEVDLPGEPGTLVVKEQWFPGWVASLGGRELGLESTADGLMVLTSDGTPGRLELNFAWTRWDRRAGLISSGLTLVLLWGSGRRRPLAGGG